MTIDRLISSDLAMLAVDARRNVPRLDALVPAVSAERAERTPSEHAALLRLSNAFADGAARAAWGATALVSVVTLLAMLDLRTARAHWVPLDRGHWDFIEPGNEVLDWFGDLTGPTTAVGTFLIGALVAGIVQRRWAARFTAEIGKSPRPLEHARALVARIAPWSLALGIAGVTAFGVFFAALIAFRTSDPGMTAMASWLTDHTGPMASWVTKYPRFYLVFSQQHRYGVDRLRDLSIAVPSAIVLAVWVARRRPRALLAPWLRYVAAAVAVLAACAAFRIALAPQDMGRAGTGVVPSFELVRSLVTGLGAAALFIAAASRALRRSADAQRP